MIFGYLESRIGRHFVFESIFVLTVIAMEDILIDIQHTVFNVFLTKSVEEFSVQIISNTTTIQDLTDHVFQDCCVDLLDLVLLRCHHS